MNILLTGTSGNLGAATAEYLLAQKHSIVASVQPGEQPNPALAKCIPMDLADEISGSQFVDEGIQTLGSIDCGILLVGGYAGGDIAQTDWNLMERMINLNFKTAWNVSRPLFTHMTSKSNGRIILVGAKPAVHAEAGVGAVAYTLSKSLILRLSELINAAGKSKGVDCAVIVPSVIDTPENRQDMPNADFSKWVKPQAIAEVIGWLCSPASMPLRETVIKVYGAS